LQQHVPKSFPSKYYFTIEMWKNALDKKQSLLTDLIHLSNNFAKNVKCKEILSDADLKTIYDALNQQIINVVQMGREESVITVSKDLDDVVKNFETVEQSYDALVDLILMHTKRTDVENSHALLSKSSFGALIPIVCKLVWGFGFLDIMLPNQIDIGSADNTKLLEIAAKYLQNENILEKFYVSKLSSTDIDNVKTNFVKRLLDSKGLLEMTFHSELNSDLFTSAPFI